MVSQRPRRQYMVLQWGQVDLQEYANGSLVSNKNIFTIPFLNTYYHKQMKRILIAAYNETFRQSSDPVYAHTPMRNTGELRTFNPKLKDSAGGEVNYHHFFLAAELNINSCSMRKTAAIHTVHFNTEPKGYSIAIPVYLLISTTKHYVIGQTS